MSVPGFLLSVRGEVRVQRIEHVAHLFEQLFVVFGALACAGHHSFEADRLGCAGAADVERVHDCAKAPQRRILVEPEAC